MNKHKDEVTSDSSARSYFCDYYTRKDIPRAIYQIKRAHRGSNPLVCYECKVEVDMRVRFGGQSYLGWELMREICFTCPACTSAMGYFV